MEMSLTPRLTLIGLYNFNQSLFSNLILPDGINEEIFIDTLLMKYGECPLISPNLDYMLLAIGAWSRKWYDNVERIFAALNAEYNPIYNYDRHEEWTGTDGYTMTGTDGYTINGTDARTTDEEGSISRTYGSDTEHKVSAYNESTYQEDSKDITTGTDATNTNDHITTAGNNSETKSGTKGETKSGNDSRTGHIFGNIGTTKSQEMVLDEISLRAQQNIYDIIVNDN